MPPGVGFWYRCLAVVCLPVLQQGKGEGGKD